jgi:hypothetical protein
MEDGSPSWQIKRKSMRVLTLIVCSRAKRPGLHAATDLYVSSRFRRQQKLANTRGTWYVLSAKHGVIEPSRRVRSYDLSLQWLSAQSRIRWAKASVRAIREVAKKSAVDMVLVDRKHSYTAALLPIFPLYQFIRVGQRDGFDVWRSWRTPRECRWLTAKS